MCRACEAVHGGWACLSEVSLFHFQKCFRERAQGNAEMFSSFALSGVVHLSNLGLTKTCVFSDWGTV